MNEAQVKWVGVTETSAGSVVAELKCSKTRPAHFTRKRVPPIPGNWNKSSPVRRITASPFLNDSYFGDSLDSCQVHSWAVASTETIWHASQDSDLPNSSPWDRSILFGRACSVPCYTPYGLLDYTRDLANSGKELTALAPPDILSPAAKARGTLGSQLQFRVPADTDLNISNDSGPIDIRTPRIAERRLMNQPEDHPASLCGS
ncbi:hypothetical protein N7468_004363 [Penicillium chermesinum]|uniref:Uncharacterized protein n=1 Tax=Penicillium chermesinum TaxID=63820 RepID=A0A9W9P8F3_9EURO|nr:uncharacterized protein N7468_004363 [Penicillium chermesinum]KAJ5239744.1 hypothetical protein N7468_004363 [Penicillium chermesinum]